MITNLEQLVMMIAETYEYASVKHTSDRSTCQNYNLDVNDIHVEVGTLDYHNQTFELMIEYDPYLANTFEQVKNDIRSLLINNGLLRKTIVTGSDVTFVFDLKCNLCLQ